MALDKDLDDRIRQGIKDRDLKTVDVLRMLKARLLERRTAKGFTGEVDDALVLDVIAAYRKQLQKALAEFEKLGERGAAQAAQLRFEIGVCGGYLPQGLGDDELRALVKERIGALAIGDAKQIGRLVGDVMKTHKGLADAADVKRIAEELLKAVVTRASPACAAVAPRPPDRIIRGLGMANAIAGTATGRISGRTRPAERIRVECARSFLHARAMEEIEP